MENLTKKEEQIMQIIWKLRKAFVNDIIKKLPEPKPPYNTISSIVRILESKGFVSYKAYGRTHEYYPIVSKASYRKHSFKQLISNYFDGSYQELVSFIISEKESNITKEDEEELKKITSQLK